jgi:two-component system response regulator VanR
MAYRILVVEDDLAVQEVIQQFLMAQEYRVEAAEDGLEAWEMLKAGPYDLVILDVMLPRLDGFSLCRMIRQKSSVPIIVLTALSEEKDQVRAFELEADDYIAKPFSFTVLSKRVEAVLRRAHHPNVSGGREMTYGRIRLDLDGFKTYVDHRIVDLTLKEFEIVQALLENLGRVMTREMLLDRIWGYDFYGDNRIVDAHIKNIRRKLDLSDIKTVKGVGYVIEREPDEENRDHL